MKELSTEKRENLLSEIDQLLTAYGLNPQSLILMTTYHADPRMVEYICQSDGSNPIVPMIHGVMNDVLSDLQKASPYPPLHCN